ncbi:MAG: GntR family transcriptional regulator [Sedimentitalea sp.]
MSPAPKASYHAIKAEVLERIRSQVWPPGAMLPGDVVLAREFGCARSTLTRAMQELAHDGILERKRKAGTRVRPTPERHARLSIPLVRDEVTASGAQYSYQLLRSTLRAAPAWLSTRLDIAPGTQMLFLECLHSGDATPFQYEQRWINLNAVAAQEVDFTQISPNAWLVAHMPLSNAELVFSAAPANDDVAGHLDVPLGSPVFVKERVTWFDGAPLTHTRMFYHAGYCVVSQI